MLSLIIIVYLAAVTTIGENATVFSNQQLDSLRLDFLRRVAFYGFARL